MITMKRRNAPSLSFWQRINSFGMEACHPAPNLSILFIHGKNVVSVLSVVWHISAIINRKGISVFTVAGYAT